MTTSCEFKIEGPSQGPGRIDFTVPDEGFGLDGTPKPKIQRDPSPQKLSGPLEGEKSETRIWSFHLNTLGVPKLVPHPGLKSATPAR